MNLIPEASMWHKMWSSRLAIVGAAFSIIGIVTSAYMNMTPGLKGSLPDWLPTLVAFLAFLSAIGVPIVRVIKQTKLQIDDSSDQAGT